jgi:hypothetical protein
MQEEMIQTITFKRNHLYKIFAVVNVEHVRELGFSVYQNDEGYRGHAVIRPSTPIPMDVFGVRLLQIPSFVMEVMNKKSSRALWYVVTEKDRVVQSEPFTGIKENWGWDEGETHVMAAESVHD